MKKLIFVCLLALLSSCTADVKKDIAKQDSVKTIPGSDAGYYSDSYRIIIIDSCEYILISPGSENQSLIHKGNCKNPIHYKH